MNTRTTNSKTVKKAVKKAVKKTTAHAHEVSLLLAEEQLQQSLQDWRTTFNSISDPLSIQDKDFKLVQVNAAYERFTGKKAAELIGRQCYNIIHNTTCPIENCPHKRTLASGQVEVFELHDAAQNKWFDVTTTPWLNDDGGIAGTIHIIKDVTDHKLAFLALKEKNFEIELSNSALEQAIERSHAASVQAQLATMAKGQFLATMSHEIRTPLNGVMGMIDLLLDTSLNDEQQKFARIVKTSSEALLSIVDEILDFSKIEAGKMTLEYTVFKLSDIFDDVLDIMAVKAIDKGLEFGVLIDPRIPPLVSGDRTRLRQIVLNLAANAVKFTEHGWVLMDVRLDKQSETNYIIKIIVTDTGIGVAADEQKSLFQQFYQVDGSRTRRYGGTGLGLAISKRLTELMGGTIGFNSVEGQGSSFYCSVPFAVDEKKRFVPGPVTLTSLMVITVGLRPLNRRIIDSYLQTWEVPVFHSEEIAHAESAKFSVRDVECRSLILIIEPGCELQVAAHLQHQNYTIGGSAIKALLCIVPVRNNLKTICPDIKVPICKIFSPLKKEELFQALQHAHEPAALVVETLPTAPPLVKSDPSIIILCAEDDSVSSILLERVFNSLGITIELVSNGREAIAALSQRSYDCVLLDLHMPLLDGIETAGVIRDQASTVLDHAVPIIALTASTVDADREACGKAGMDGYLTKPLRRESIIKLVGELKKKGVHEVGANMEAEGDDAKRMVELLHSDADVYADVMALFFTAVPKHLSALDLAIASADYSSVKRVAHTVKGACLNVEARHLSRLAAQVGEVAQKDSAHLAHCVERLNRHFQILMLHVQPTIPTSSAITGRIL